MEESRRGIQIKIAILEMMVELVSGYLSMQLQQTFSEESCAVQHTVGQNILAGWTVSSTCVNMLW